MSTRNGLRLTGIGLLSALSLSMPAALHAQQPEQAARLKEHAKLYHFHTGKDLAELAKMGTGDIEVRAATFSGPGGLSGAVPPSPYPHPYLVNFAYTADAVVVGVVRDPVAALTEERDFVFTDWTVTVEEVIKDNPKAPIQPNSDIIVTRPGGTLVLNGRNVKAIDALFYPFRAGGRYVLFLYSVSGTGSYRAFQDETFELPQKGVRKLTPSIAGVDVKNKQDPAAFLSEVRAAVAIAR